jgi:hypothetical protein
MCTPVSQLILKQGCKSFSEISTCQSGKCSWYEWEEKSSTVPMGKRKGKRPFGRNRHRWDDIRMALAE